MTAIVQWFDDIRLADVGSFGGKNASLGELRRALVPVGLRVPNGFATHADAYRDFLSGSGVGETIRDALAGMDTTDIDRLRVAGERIRTAILKATLPTAFRDAITTAYRRLEQEYGPRCDVAVRSSATAEDLPGASFAGQQESYLNVRGEEELLDAVHRCFASLFTDRAISYRAEHGFDHLQVALSVGVQKMVRSDLGSAGVMFSLDTESGFRDVVLVSAAYGLGESVVQGTVDTDEYWVHKPTLLQGFQPLVRRRLGAKEVKLVYDEGGGRRVRSERVPEADRQRFVLRDEEVLQLARWACAVEDHYSTLYGTPTPMDMEWAKDGVTGELFLLQARPETGHAREGTTGFERYQLEGSGEVLVRGRSVGERIGQGRARVIRSVAELDRLQPGEVLVTGMTDPDWEPVLKRAAAVVTDHGGRTCHAAIVSRELGIPAVVGTGDGMQRIPDGAEVTVSCAAGEEGLVYRGLLPIRKETVRLSALPRLRTRLFLNVGNPAEAFALASLPCDGVGLARTEFIVSSHIRVHPMALVHFDQVRDPAARAEIQRLTAGYADRAAYFVERLAEGIGTIAAAFWPREVIVRLSDFKTNEYAGLLGGAPFEPVEENPMLGFRGAARYYDARYREGFALECAALRRVRDTMGLRNAHPMVPFCRTPAEGERVVEEMARNGLRRGENGLEVYAMCEVPSNVLLMEDFARVFDGFSIGSNDLTQLVLGVDRDSELVAHLYDERSPAVQRMVEEAIRRAHWTGRKIGICGQAPSDFHEFTEFLVQQRIDSISVNPDVLLSVLTVVGNAERNVPDVIASTANRGGRVALGAG
jgi:pyruvate,water dikinase